LILKIIKKSYLEKKTLAKNKFKSISYHRFRNTAAQVIKDRSAAKELIGNYNKGSNDRTTKDSP
jgi:hypothetical protein